ncbi:MAG: 2Fe-2S iron-sulfur cluster-binding protein [Rhodocyclales bacterium]|nr:2Fe-2S iron-sulfur cluster-binding protein [Rhodocyclales bacterium]
MITITFILNDGTRHSIDAESEANVMQVATFNDVRGIEGACGGFCSCATCHVYVESAHALPAPAADEETMLTGTAAKRESNSRLACQLKLGPELDGLVVRMPEVQ